VYKLSSVSRMSRLDKQKQTISFGRLLRFLLIVPEAVDIMPLPPADGVPENIVIGVLGQSLFSRINPLQSLISFKLYKAPLSNTSIILNGKFQSRSHLLRTQHSGSSLPPSCRWSCSLIRISPLSPPTTPSLRLFRPPSSPPPPLLPPSLRPAKHTLTALPIRTLPELLNCHALIIPGGESTVIASVASNTPGLLEGLQSFVRDPGRAVWGTCAGMILMAEEDGIGGGKVIKGRERQRGWGGIEGLRVWRNLYGSTSSHLYTKRRWY